MTFSSKSVALIILSLTVSIISHNVPIIGILANPNPIDDGDLIGSHINASYVRWLENAGATTMVIHAWYTQERLDEIMSSVNGVIMLGGDRNLNLNNPFEKTAAYLLKKSIESYRQGNPIPIWGTCQGFELIQSIVMGNLDLRVFDSENYPSPIRIEKADARILRFFSKEDLTAAETMDIFAEFHHFGIEREQFQQYASLGGVFDIVATARDRQGKEYVSIIEGKRVPIYGTQFHPEMVGTNRNVDFNVPTGTYATRVSENFSNFFVNEARMNGNTFAATDKSKYHFIDSFVDTLHYDSGFYFYEFKNEESNPHLRVN
jgi:gamma-glutamyl hydrolase